jgi:hypothetical protein
MRSLTKLFLAAALVAGASYTFAKPIPAIKADTIESVDEHLSGFNSIKIAGPFTVHLVQGPVESVKIDVPDDVKGRITAEVTGGILKIHQAHDNWGWSYKSWYGEKSVWRNHKKIAVYITAKDVKFISISGSGDMTFNEGITADALKLRVRGSGSMVGKIDVKALESSLSGSGSMKLSGNAGNSKVRVIGSGNFTSSSLVTITSAVHVSGSGKAEINASDKVDAAIRGSGDVRYTGTAKNVISSTSGSGEIRRF